MVNYEQTKSLMKSRGVDNLSPLDFSFSLMVAIGINEIQSYMVTIRGKEYEKKTEEQIPKFRERCSLEVTDYLERTDIKETIRFLRAEHDRNIKDTALQLEDIDFNAEDLRKILAKFLKEKYKDIDAADAKDLLNAIKIYVDKFGDSGEDGVAKFNQIDSQTQRYQPLTLPTPFGTVHPLRQQKVANRDQSQQKKVCTTTLIIEIIREKRYKQDTGCILTLQQCIYYHKGSKQPEEDTTTEYHRCLRIVGKHIF